MTDVFTLFFALLALLSVAGAVTVMGLSLAGRADQVAEVSRLYGLPLAATVATVASLGSLYLSEIAGFVPCRLCWVQRGFMYPLAAALWLAVWRRRSGRRWSTIGRLALPWSLAGAAVSGYHIADQRGWIGGESFCDPVIPCSAIWVEQFGFITIPVMALAGFLFVAALTWVQQQVHRADEYVTETA